MSRPIVIVGAGGHGREIAEIVLEAHRGAKGPPLFGIIDDFVTRLTGGPEGVEILGTLEWLAAHAEEVDVVVGLGDNRIRRNTVERCRQYGARFGRAISPCAHLSSSASIGVGAMVFPGAVISLNTRLGEHVIVGTNAGVSHDCSVGDFGFLCPGARITGAVSLAEGVMLGANSCVIPGKKVGAWTTVGAGGVVNRDLPEGVVAVGVPARPLQK